MFHCKAIYWQAYYSPLAEFNKKFGWVYFIQWIYVTQFTKLLMHAQQYFCDKPQYKNNGQITAIKLCKCLIALTVSELML